jgi:light-regulated signal transduction histidine kinase (bacteriophytochrome)
VRISAVEQGGQVVFSVKDNGIGFDPIYNEQVFGIFKRLHTTKQYSGTGMGLAICQRIVQRYRGRIWADSEVGKGSEFFFAIPK